MDVTLFTYMRNVKYREVRYAINRDNNEPYCRYLVKIYTLLTFIDTVSYMVTEKEGRKKRQSLCY